MVHLGKMGTIILILPVMLLVNFAQSAVLLHGFDSYVVKGAQDSTTVTCVIEFDSEVVVNSKLIRWVVGSGESAVTLDVDDSAVSWDDSSRLTTLNVEPAPEQSTSYQCQYAGADTNSSASLIVLGFEESPVSTHIQKDSTVGLGCALPSSPYTASIQWYKDDQATELPQNAVSSFLQVAESGSYKCVATYTAQENFAGGQTTSDVATVTMLSDQEYPTSNCWTRECGFCSSIDCTVKQDLSTSDQGITVTSTLDWRKYNNIVLYDAAGNKIGKFRWNLRGIFLTGCMACQTSRALRRARVRGGPTQWSFNVRDGVVQIAVKGNVLYSQKLADECAETYGKIGRFAFENMGCENTFSFVEKEMKMGDTVLRNGKLC